MSKSIQALTASIDRNLPVSLEFLRDLVSLNSFTSNANGVNANARRIVEQFGDFGFRVDFRPCELCDAGDHLVLDSGGSGPAIACILHLDTVYPPDEEERLQFVWRDTGDRIYGPGTFDMKGGTALLWLVLASLRDCFPAQFNATRWILLWNAAEERLAPDFSMFAKEMIPVDASACLVFEGDGSKDDDFTLVTGRKGLGRFKVKAFGRAGHSGNAHQFGANAIVQLARAVENIADLTDYASGTTVNVGRISGGHASNRIPDQAEAEVDVRFADERSYISVREKILSGGSTTIVRAHSDGFSCSLNVNLEQEVNAWMDGDTTEGLFEFWRKAGTACGFEITSSVRGGVSDANRLSEMFPILDGLGPKGGHEHCAGCSSDGGQVEYVDRKSLTEKALLNALALQFLIQAQARNSISTSP